MSDNLPATRPERALESVRGVLRDLGYLSTSTYRLTRGFLPLLRMLASETDITTKQMGEAIDAIFAELYKHPLVRSTQKATSFLRAHRLLPNEQSTEELLRFVVQQVVQRSPVSIPAAVLDEFWQFFNELFAQPELKGLGEISFDMMRLILRTYEPTLVEVVNLLKGSRRHNERQMREVMHRAALLRDDLAIVRRQVRALRHIRPFFQTEPKDFSKQAQIVAEMVREFGPFFVKLAQVAAANADFLPEEIGRELAVFHEDVPPMTEEEVKAAFIECYGQLPDKLFMDFDAAHPVRSGSIGSIYVAKKPFIEHGDEVLRSVVIKVGRHNIQREFEMGKMVLGLAILSSHLWAPHSKIEPFLRAMQQQVDEFVAGFVEELDFECEAQNQQRFYQRSLRTKFWRVPALYNSASRILEMEYLSDAASLTRALKRMGPRQRRRFQAKVSERLLYTVLHHVFLYNELHGDLHPGNIMVGSDGGLYLIDWGNVVQLDGKWGPVWDYLVGAILADTELLTETLIRMSVDPQESRARYHEIRALLDETLQKKDITPLTRSNLVSELRQRGVEGLLARGRAVAHLLANTQQSGIVLNRDYLHLSRSVFALAGSFGSLYEDTDRRVMTLDLVRSLIRMPLMATRDLTRSRLQRLRGMALRLLSVEKPQTALAPVRPSAVQNSDVVTA